MKSDLQVKEVFFKSCLRKTDGISLPTVKMEQTLLCNCHRKEGSRKGKAGSRHPTCRDNTDRGYIRTKDSIRALSSHLLDALGAHQFFSSLHFTWDNHCAHYLLFFTKSPSIWAGLSPCCLLPLSTQCCPHQLPLCLLGLQKWETDRLLQLAMKPIAHGVKNKFSIKDFPH